MNRKLLTRLLLLVFVPGIVLLSFRAEPEDIDLFSVDEGNNADVPNVLFVLDNSANWSRQSQQWPGDTQGQAEARAIKQVISELADNSVNVGLLEYSTAGNASENDGGYVRYHIRPMDGANKAELGVQLDMIRDNINEPIEKRSSGNPFGDLFWDIYNYLAGIDQSKGGAGTPADRADGAAYSNAYARFRSPLTTADSCRRTIVIFIGNNVQSGPTADSAANVSALGTVGGDTSQMPFQNYTVQNVQVATPLEYSTACYDDVDACSAAENTEACREGGYTSCSCSATEPLDCSASRFSVVGVNTTTTTTVVSDDNPGVTEANVYTGENRLSCKTAGQVPDQYTCPSISTQITTSGSQSTEVTTSWTNCSYVNVGATNPTCTTNKSNYEPRGTRTRRTIVRQIDTTTTRTPVGETAACYTDVATCSTSGFNCSAYSEGCFCDTPGSADGCPATTRQRYRILGNSTNSVATPTGTYSTPPTQGGSNFMADEWARFLRQIGVPLPGSDPSAPVRATVTTYAIDVFNAQQNPSFSALLFNMARAGGGRYYQARDENAIIDALRKIFNEIQAVNTAFSSASLPVNATNRAQNENQVFIGLFRPDREKKPRWFGNLKRYQLVADANGIVDLGDKDGNPAINLQTGFIADCAVSYWTTPSGDYWQGVISDNPDAVSGCDSVSDADRWSDSPDGPFVEKGAVAHVLRKGNNPSGTPDAQGNYAVSRNMKTLSGTNLVDFTTGTTGLSDALVRFVLGEDTEDEDLDGGISTRGLTEPRASIHGDVIHSRPQPVNYGGSTGVVAFYGANDGTFRAVKAETGEELWSFIAPEHLAKLNRLKGNGLTDDQLIRFFDPNDPNDEDPTRVGTPKDYFFDGSIGLFQNADNTAVYVYPSMRRGGRKIYAFNVTNPVSPQFLWSKGCPSLTSDAGCDGDFAGIGQTWSVPSVAFIKGYQAGAQPVVIFGGGYDACEDENTAAPSCGSAKGRGVYVVNAATGALIKHFDFSGLGSRSVAADVALIDINADGFVDYAYAADTGGNVFRMDFIDAPDTKSPLASASWRASRIAYTNGAGRKFLYPPALLQNGDLVYLALGSGDREHPLAGQYPYENVANRFYAFRDELSDVDPDTALNLDDEDEMYDYTEPTDCNAEKIVPGSEKKGWFVQFQQGEQTVTSALIAAGFAVVSTNRPTPEAETLACTNSLGEARGYFLNLLNASGGVGTSEACGGERSGVFVGGGLPPSPVIATVEIAGAVRTVIIGAVQRTGGASSPVGAQRVPPPINAVRRPIYWYKPVDAE